MKTFPIAISLALFAFSALVKGATTPEPASKLPEFFRTLVTELPALAEERHQAHHELEALIKPENQKRFEIAKQVASESLKPHQVPRIMQVVLNQEHVKSEPFFRIHFNDMDAEKIDKKEVVRMNQSYIEDAQINVKLAMFDAYFESLVPAARLGKIVENDAFADQFGKDSDILYDKVREYDDKKRMLSNLRKYYEAICGCCNVERKAQVFYESLAEAFSDKDALNKLHEEKPKKPASSAIWNCLMKGQNAVSSRANLGVFATVCLGACAGLLVYQDFEGIKEVFVAASKGLN